VAVQFDFGLAVGEPVWFRPLFTAMVKLLDLPPNSNSHGARPLELKALEFGMNLLLETMRRGSPFQPCSPSRVVVSRWSGMRAALISKSPPLPSVTSRSISKAPIAVLQRERQLNSRAGSQTFATPRRIPSPSWHIARESRRPILGGRLRNTREENRDRAGEAGEARSRLKPC